MQVRDSEHTQGNTGRGWSEDARNRVPELNLTLATSEQSLRWATYHVGLSFSTHKT